MRHQVQLVEADLAHEGEHFLSYMINGIIPVALI